MDAKKKLEKLDKVLDELEQDMDKGFMETGRNLAELYRAVCTAALVLPKLDLSTDLMQVTNNEDGLTVFFDRSKVDRKHSRFEDCGYDDFEDEDYDDDDEEEGLIYDGD